MEADYIMYSDSSDSVFFFLRRDSLQHPTESTFKSRLILLILFLIFYLVEEIREVDRRDVPSCY